VTCSAVEINAKFLHFAWQLKAAPIRVYDWMLLRRCGDHFVDIHADVDIGLDLKVNLFLCFKVSIAPGACECGRLTIHLHAVLTWALDGGEFHAVVPGFLIQEKVSPLSKIHVFCEVLSVG
jgi:hypothetical protein